MDKDKFFDSIENAPKFTKRHESDLEALLRNEAILAAFSSALNDSKLASERFRDLDFSEPKQVAKAIRLQGQGDGVIFLIEHLADLVQDEEETEDGS